MSDWKGKLIRSPNVHYFLVNKHQETGWANRENHGWTLTELQTVDQKLKFNFLMSQRVFFFELLCLISCYIPSHTERKREQCGYSNRSSRTGCRRTYMQTMCACNQTRTHLSVCRKGNIYRHMLLFIFHFSSKPFILLPQLIHKHQEMLAYDLIYARRNIKMEKSRGKKTKNP